MTKPVSHTPSHGHRLHKESQPTEQVIQERLNKLAKIAIHSGENVKVKEDVFLVTDSGKTRVQLSAQKKGNQVEVSAKVYPI
jgi:hypothetical protein